MLKATKPGGSSHGTNGNQDGQEVHDHWKCDDTKDDNDKEHLVKLMRKMRVININMLGNCMQAVENPPLTINDEIYVIVIRLFSVRW